ncbi:hypothetical protein [Dokdonella sp.]|uniref:hypothetical protein n=1 Tax=Dokdonella sp. TaxID=2291710 RepID=UPI0027B8DFD1|nr:hypothetical protein [Dokdonella sp.]
MTKRTPSLLRGSAPHRRTQTDYMGALTDVVTLGDWRDVVATALVKAKDGDPHARAWLAQYLVGKPDAKAPTPLTVVIQQLNGADPVVDGLARPIIDRQRFPSLAPLDDADDVIRERVAAELADRIGK